jgi:ABC-2 type transport system permease protein
MLSWRSTVAPDRRGGTSAWRTGPVPAWLRLFRSELRLVYGRPRSWALLGLLCGVPVFFGVLFRLVSSARVGPRGGPAFENQIAGNGLFLALVVLSLLMLVILPLVIAVVSGDTIAGESSLGTLRGLLTVPAGRTRLLAVKYAVIVVFSVSASLLVATVSIGLAASTLTQHPVAAMAVTLVIVVGSEIGDQVPQLARIQPLLPSHYWLSWDGLFRACRFVRDGAWAAGVRCRYDHLRIDRVGPAYLG